GLRTGGSLRPNRRRPQALPAMRLCRDGISQRQRSHALFFRLRKTGRVAGHGVDLDIDLVPFLTLAPCRDRQRVMDEQHIEARALDAVDRQRGAVQRDRTLRRYELRQFARGLQREAHRIALGLAFHDPRLAVDMARYDVAAKLVADLERA